MSTLLLNIAILSVTLLTSQSFNPTLAHFSSQSSSSSYSSTSSNSTTTNATTESDDYQPLSWTTTEPNPIYLYVFIVVIILIACAITIFILVFLSKLNDDNQIIPAQSVQPVNRRYATPSNVNRSKTIGTIIGKSGNSVNCKQVCLMGQLRTL